MSTSDFSVEGLTAEYHAFIATYGFRPNVLQLPAFVFKAQPFHLPIPGANGCQQLFLDCHVNYFDTEGSLSEAYYGYDATLGYRRTNAGLAQFVSGRLGEPHEPIQPTGSPGTQGPGPGASGTPGVRPTEYYRTRVDPHAPQRIVLLSTRQPLPSEQAEVEGTYWVLLAENDPQYKGMDHFHAGENVWTPALAEAETYAMEVTARTVREALAHLGFKIPTNCKAPVVRGVRVVNRRELQA